jgi:hypothetical protein
VSRNDVSISIGGSLAPGQLAAFYDAIAVDGAGYAWGDGPFATSPEDLRDFIASLAPGPLVMTDNDHLRHFDAVEAFCIAAGLTFTSHVSASADGDAELRWWSPELIEVHRVSALGGCSPAFTLHALLERVGAGSPEEQVANLRALAAENTPPVVPRFELSGAPRRTWLDLTLTSARLERAAADWTRLAGGLPIRVEGTRSDEPVYGFGEELAVRRLGARMGAGRVGYSLNLETWYYVNR